MGDKSTWVDITTSTGIGTTFEGECKEIGGCIEKGLKAVGCCTDGWSEKGGWIDGESEKIKGCIDGWSEKIRV